MDKNRIISEIKNYLIGTREFTNMARAIEELKHRPEAYAPVLEFRKKRKALGKPDIDEQTAYRIMYELEQDYESLSKHRVIAAYFDSEEQLGALIEGLINEANAVIANELEIQL